MAAIKAKKEVSLARFVFALGIIHVGEETAIDLAEHFGTLEKLEHASAERLLAVPNIGEVVAHSIYDWFHDKTHRQLVAKLRSVGVRVKAESRKRKAAAQNAKVFGKTFVLTGTLKTMTRDEAKQRIRALGGDVSESVSKKTDYVVVGRNPGLKFERAKKLGVHTLDEKEFWRIFNYQ